MKQSLKYKRLFDKAKSIRLDVGCGLFKQEGCLGMDMMNHPNVDIVHDIQKFPWPIPDNICSFILLSHVWEHIEPKYRFQLMDELWRICRHDGQLWIAAPYAGSFLEAAHPAHYMCPNECTFQFFDPEHALWHSCSYKKPLPWQILKDRMHISIGGCIELVMKPRKDEKGKSLKCPDKPTVYAPVQLMERKQVDEVKWPERKKRHVQRKNQNQRQRKNRDSK